MGLRAQPMERLYSGYSLVEVLTVVFLLSVLATVAIPNLSASDAKKLDLAVEEFAQAIRFARSEAIRTGAARGIRRQSSQNRIRVFSVDTSVTPWAAVYDVYHPVSKALYDVDLDDHPFARVDAMNSATGWRDTCNAVSYLWFDALGVPRCLDPNTVLAETFATELILGGERRTLVVDSVTGRVHVQ